MRKGSAARSATPHRHRGGNDCTINGNIVDFGDDSATNTLTSFGFSIYGSRIVLSANVARRVDAGISMDGAGGSTLTNAWEDNVIIGNMLSGNEMAVRIQNNSQSFLNWNWVGNNFHAQGRRWLSMWTSETWRANKISNHRFVGNTFSGEVQKEKNLRLSNYREPHAFIGNSFSTPPSIDSGAERNTMYGSGNSVRGKTDDRAFGAK